MSLINAIERFSENRIRVDLWSAIAAGLCAGICTSLEDALDHPVNPSLYAKSLILSTAAYLMVAWLLRLSLFQSVRRVVPSWLIIALVGSTLFVVMDLAPAVIVGWTRPQRIEQSLAMYISHELYAAGVVIVFFAIITIPITALVYYAAGIVRAAKTWHDGPEAPSISDSPRMRR
jgi:hypothetical protein